MHLPAVFTALAVTASSAMADTPGTDLIHGHYEIHIDYTPTPGNPDAGWRFSVSYDEDDDFSTSAGVVRMDPEAVSFVASPATEAVVPTPSGVFGRFGPSGTPLHVLPQNNVLGTLFLGVRTTMSPGIFQARVGNNYTPAGQGSISLRLISVEGTGPDAGGHFATWKTESFGNAVFSFDTTDGIGSGDEIPTIPVSSHTHYNWALTKPGIYRVTFEAMGKLVSPNIFTSGRGTFTFVVPFSGRVGAGGRIQLTENAGGLAVADPVLNVAYAPDQAMIEAWTPAGAGREVGLDLSALASQTANGVGLEPQETSAASWSAAELRIHGSHGPGGFSLHEPDGAPLGTEVGFIPGQARPVKAVFGADGIHRVVVFIAGIRDGLAVETAPVTLTFGAGLGVDFDYAAWSESFERAAGWPAGSLSDPSADTDGDGVSNGAEFALFWHGMDPTRADARFMPRAMRTAEGGAVEFLRDTWKDRLNESGWEIRPETSVDLVSWERRSSRVPGFPLEIFETHAGPGNARGRISRQQLRAITSPTDRRFFRFSIESP